MERDWEPLPPYRAVLAVDARNFSPLNSAGQRAVNAGIQEVLAQTLATIGMEADWRHHTFGQHTGDGYVGGLDPILLPGLVGSFPEALSSALRGWRSDYLDDLQLRVSVHVGPLDDTGIGDPMVHTHRLLDEDLLRKLLDRADPKVTNTAVIISDRVYEDVFRSGASTGKTVAGHYLQRIAKVKTFERPAWIHVPGLDWQLVDPALLETRPSSAPPEDDAPSTSSPDHLPAPANIAFHQHGDGQQAQGYQVTAHFTGGRND
ncbi:hypothetical protein GCM10029976_047810 [Kribbella albertanoniae]|uniref:Uncharacterized protein n=1 Tax=Kribbella albertanoniae TaxID=1266829 RepID=A0A4R4Q3R8_9ACTN|nr:hypothetical protein [Kribbella albertanoniae]TDC29741.1 hypothetical protein E1261_15110 [Kribbella albertanoniae]